ncbi:hypothetical protein [Xanthomonas campestris]|uniref:hypothetical protein n=1 Tax=Xanthomonas campestris TaxID=339 RepID=UPI000E0E8B63|nr:hypothetical protein [Xanthomonas campestris]
MILYSLNTDPPASVVSQFRLHGTPGPQRDDDLPPSNDPSPRRGGIDDEVGDLDNPENDDDQALPGRVGGGLAGQRSTPGCWSGRQCRR